ncbi:MAG: hypothetical protein LKE37_09740 [Atopobiaceae bacterium]|jgi:hypothetical protein|nr:hypothetical protein [Atopobiaceae bacterium]
MFVKMSSADEKIASHFFANEGLDDTGGVVRLAGAHRAVHVEPRRGLVLHERVDVRPAVAVRERGVGELRRDAGPCEEARLLALLGRLRRVGDLPVLAALALAPAPRVRHPVDLAGEDRPELVERFAAMRAGDLVGLLVDEPRRHCLRRRDQAPLAPLFSIHSILLSNLG